MAQPQSIPLQSVQGSTPESTKALRVLFYVSEVERQAEVFNDAFLDAVRAAEAGAHQHRTVFRHIQSALFAAIVVNRLVRPSKRSGKLAIERGQMLRDLLALGNQWDATPILSMAMVRHHLEHVDERLDDALNDDRIACIADWYLCDPHLLISPDDGSQPQARSALRAFSPETGMLFFDTDSLDLMQLDIDMLMLRHNAREAQDECLQQVVGRSTFGGQAIRVIEHPEKRVAWLEKRDRLLNEMAPPPRLEGQARLWMRVSPPNAPSSPS